MIPQNSNLSSTEWMATTMLTRLVAQSNPAEFGEHLTEQVRELTGARTVLLFTHQENLGCKPLAASPARQLNLFTRKEGVELCPSCAPEELPVKVDDFPQDQHLREVLISHGIDSIIRLPLDAGGVLNGSLLMLNLPDPERVEDILNVLNFLGPFFGISLQNSLAQEQIRKQNEQLEEKVRERTRELSASQRFLRTIIDTLPIRIFWKDCNSRYQGCNQLFAEDVGKTDCREVIGKTEMELLPAKAAARFLAEDQEIINRQQSILDHEFEYTLPNGDKRWFLISKVPLKDHLKRVIGILGIYSDITESKSMRAALEKRIVALTRPVDDTESITFEDLFDHHEIQLLQDFFAEATGASSVITSPEGMPITIPSNFGVLRRTVVGGGQTAYDLCIKKSSIACTEGGELVRPCCETALYSAGVKLVVEDRHIANWIIGQVRDPSLTENDARSIAHMLGAEEEAFLQAFAEIPVISKEQFEKYARVLVTFGKQLSKDAYLNMQQARFIAREKRRTARLRQLSTAIDQSPESIVITDTEGRIEYVNPAFETVSGYKFGEVLGRNSKILKSNKQNDEFYGHLWKTISRGEVWYGRLVNLRKDGAEYVEDVSIAPVRNKQGEIVNYVAVKKDVTEELERDEQFRQSQKMEAVGQLAGGIAHDFNNILQAIMGFSEMLLMDLDQDSNEYQNIEEIDKAAKRAADLTRQLLTFSRKQPVDQAVLDLNDTVENAASLLKVLLGDRIELELNQQAEQLMVEVDQGQITQVIMNLAVNARDAMPEGGHLCLETSLCRIDKERAANHPDAHAGLYVQLDITDNGSGMSEDVLAHLFEPFFTTKRLGKGTGLGLAVVYGVVKQNKGWIQVDSQLGAGTKFSLFFPQAVPHLQHAETEVKRSEKMQRILCLLQKEDDRDRASSALNLAGHKVVAAKSISEAAALAEVQDAPFNLVFCDAVLPDGDLDSLIQQMRTTQHVLPFLLLCHSGDAVDFETYSERNGFYSLTQPFNITSLLTVVHRASNAGY